MNEQKAKEILDTVVGQIFGYQNPLSLEQAMTKFAFDIRLPQQVYDTSSGEPTWAATMSKNNYLTLGSVNKRNESNGGLREKRTIASINDVLSAWNEVNYVMAERAIGSQNYAESDGVYHSENVYRSIDIRKSKNILFSDGVDASEFIVAGQTSKSSQYCIRIEDSKNISNSFNVIWSNKITSSMFIQDSYDLYECMFCTHLAGKKFCIANMQYDEAEYRKVKELVIRWVFS